MFRTIEQIVRGYGALDIFIEIAVIWTCVFFILRFLKGTRGAGVIKGFAVVVVVITLLFKVMGQGGDTLGRLSFIYEQLVGLAALLLIVVFQPELRQFMIKIGRARFFRPSQSQVSRLVDAVTESVDMLSHSQFGALMAIERSVGLTGIVEGGERIDAEVSARLLGSIFWPNSPLHDLGVVIRGDRILRANVQFPLAEEGSVPPNRGSRHRAAVGITLESDCVAVVVSEETGGVSIVDDGVVESDVPLERFREALESRLTGPFRGARASTPQPPKPRLLPRPKDLLRKPGKRHGHRHSPPPSREGQS
jgi:diadenylate cyclase